jgi:hypothetical protein
VSAEEACDELKQVLWVPGHLDHGLSKNWRLPADSPAEGPETFDTAGLSDVDLTKVLAIFKDEARTSYGIDIDSNSWPASIKPALDKLMEDSIAQVRAEKEVGWSWFHA